jgi:hypothetical protein
MDVPDELIDDLSWGSMIKYVVCATGQIGRMLTGRRKAS